MLFFIQQFLPIFTHSCFWVAISKFCDQSIKQVFCGIHSPYGTFIGVLSQILLGQMGILVEEINSLLLDLLLIAKLFFFDRMKYRSYILMNLAVPDQRESVQKLVWPECRLIR